MAALKPAAVLAAAMALALALVLTLYDLTAASRRDHQRAHETAQLRALLQLVAPAAALPAPITLDIKLPASRLRALYPLYEGAQLTALLVHVEALAGYNGTIELLLAFRRPPAPPTPPPTPLLRVLQHRETAGIADFLTRQPEQAFDGVSGATLSATAVRQTAQAVAQWLDRCRAWQRPDAFSFPC